MTDAAELQSVNAALARAAHAGDTVEDHLRPFLAASSVSPMDWAKFGPWAHRRNERVAGERPPTWSNALASRDQLRRARNATEEFVALVHIAHEHPVHGLPGFSWPLFELPDGIDRWPARVSLDGGRKKAGERLMSLSDDVGSLRTAIHRVSNRMLLARGRL